MILTLISDGKTQKELLEDYPYLAPEDITEALKYGAWMTGAREEEVISA